MSGEKFKRASDFNTIADQLREIRESLRMESTHSEVPRLLALARTHIELAEMILEKVADFHY